MLKVHRKRHTTDGETEELHRHHAHQRGRADARDAAFHAFSYQVRKACLDEHVERVGEHHECRHIVSGELSH